MLRTALAVALFTVPMLFVTDSATSEPGLGAAPCDLYGRSPVLIVDVTGGTLTGPVFSHLAVYADGSASLSSASGFTGQVSVDTTQLPANKVQRTKRALLTSGAFGLCDQQLFISDVPLTTVTVFNGGMDATAHTFSYYASVGPYSDVGAIINDIQNQFSDS